MSGGVRGLHVFGGEWFQFVSTFTRTNHCPPVCSVLVEIQPVACVVDESLQPDASSSSSSSDDDEEEGRGEAPRLAARQRRAARAAAAAVARPVGSTMPGWIGRLQHHATAFSSSLWSSGRMCKAHAWVPQQLQPEPDGAGLQLAMEAAAAQLAAFIEAAGLSVADVAACKVYCLGSLLERHEATAAGLRHMVAGALPGVQAAVVPVAAVGPTPEAQALVMLEALAVRC